MTLNGHTLTDPKIPRLTDFGIFFLFLSFPNGNELRSTDCHSPHPALVKFRVTVIFGEGHAANTAISLIFVRHENRRLHIQNVTNQIMRAPKFQLIP